MDLSGHSGQVRLVHFVRHAESAANAGLRTSSPATVPLTERGHRQARALASCLSRPSLVVTSPYGRTKDTAAPLVVRFPGVPQEEWAVQEFTFLAPANWVGTTVTDRAQAVAEYWSRTDPAYRDGEGAESFDDLIGRVDNTLERLRALTGAAVVLVSHAGFLGALLWRLVAAPTSDSVLRMQRVFQFTRGLAMPNAGIVTCEFSGREARVGPVRVAHLDTSADS